MFYTEDQLVKFYEIKKRLSQETSRILHAQNYIEDVNFLALIIDSLESKIDSLNKDIENLSSIETNKLLQFNKELNDLLLKYNFNTTQPTA